MYKLVACSEACSSMRSMQDQLNLADAFCIRLAS